MLQDDQDVYILSKVSDIMHSLFGTYKEAMLPAFEQLLPHFVKLLVCQQLTLLFCCCSVFVLFLHFDARKQSYGIFFFIQLSDTSYVCDQVLLNTCSFRLLQMYVILGNSV